jgi:hypothetical protein
MVSEANHLTEGIEGHMEMLHFVQHDSGLHCRLR